MYVYLVEYDTSRGNEATDAYEAVNQLYAGGAVACTGRRLAEPSSAAEKRSYEVW